MGYPPFAAILGRSLEWHFYPCPNCGKKGYYIVKNPEEGSQSLYYPYILRCRYCHIDQLSSKQPEGMQLSYLKLGRRISSSRRKEAKQVKRAIDKEKTNVGERAKSYEKPLSSERASQYE